MSATTNGYGSRNGSELSRDERIAAHLERVQAELKREGIIAAVEKRERLQKRREFKSKRNAMPMTQDDVSNVAPLTLADAKLILAAMVARLLPADVEVPTGGWGPDDYRWELTPHQLRKEREQKRLRKALVG